MQGIYAYVPDTNCVPREYSVAAILLLLFMVLISLVLNIIVITSIIFNTHLQLFKFQNIYKYVIFINFGNYYI